MLDDLALSRTHFGQSINGSGSGAFGVATALPEPTSALLLLMGGLAMCSRRGAIAS